VRRRRKTQSAPTYALTPGDELVVNVVVSEGDQLSTALLPDAPDPSDPEHADDQQQDLFGGFP
jgi:hypothetical protein